VYNYCTSVSYPADANRAVAVGGRGGRGTGRRGGGTGGPGNTVGAEFVGLDLYNQLKDFFKAFVSEVLKVSSLFRFK
jgi:hypothetical protein